MTRVVSALCWCAFPLGVLVVSTAAAQECARDVHHNGTEMSQKVLSSRREQDQMMLQMFRSRMHAASDDDCCGKCSGQGFCSPVSGNCYGARSKDYYVSCAAVSSDETCCDICSGHSFCSPQSGSCYNSKAKSYYLTCSNENAPVEESTCCDSCEQGLAGFCSPQSGNCYDSQKKDYYQSCPDGGLAPPSRLQPAPSNAGAIKFMSYNLFGWNAFNQNKWKSKVILEKVKNFKPAVLGAQEVETGGEKVGNT